MSPRARWLAVALSGLALAVPSLRHLLQARMSLHMGLEFPWLLAVGAALARAAPPRWQGEVAGDAEGVTSAVVFAGVLAYWMIPSRLDASLVEPAVALAKHAGWLAAGVALSRGLAHWRREVSVFVLGNAAWMMATAGLLYQQLPARLCVNYTQDDQAVAGEALVAWATLLAGLALWRAVRAHPVATVPSAPRLGPPRPASPPRA